MSYLYIWMLTLQLFRKNYDPQGKLKLNVHSLSVSNRLAHGRWSLGLTAQYLFFKA